MRDDIKTADDIARILADEVPKNVIVTPAGGNTRGRNTNYSRQDRMVGVENIEMYYLTAEDATKQATRDPKHPARQLDSELLLGASGGLQRLDIAAKQAANKTRFRQTTKVTPLPMEGEAL